jgi:hemerythrin-like domain-containing protein
MHPIEELNLEHAPVKLMLRVLENMNEKIVGGEPVSTQDLNHGIMFLREFADKCHHCKEEDLLFIKMAKNTIPDEIRLINVLLKEHEEGRGYVKNMAEAIAKKEKCPREFSEIFLTNSKKYIALLDQHIDKENTVLFSYARWSLSETQLKELERRFEIMEEHIVGSGRHTELQNILYKLKVNYL